MLSYIINLCLQPVSENLIMTQHNIPAEQWEKQSLSRRTVLDSIWSCVGTLFLQYRNNFAQMQFLTPITSNMGNSESTSWLCQQLELLPGQNST